MRLLSLFFLGIAAGSLFPGTDAIGFASTEQAVGRSAARRDFCIRRNRTFNNVAAELDLLGANNCLFSPRPCSQSWNPRTTRDLPQPNATEIWSGGINYNFTTQDQDAIYFRARNAALAITPAGTGLYLLTFSTQSYGNPQHPFARLRARAYYGYCGRPE